MAIVAVTVLLPACTSSSKAKKNQTGATLRASITKSVGLPPKIGNGAITADGQKNVKVAFSVVTPKTDAGSSNQKITVQVWNDPTHTKLVTKQTQTQNVAGGSTAHYSFSLSGPAAARLRTAGVGPTPTAAADLVTVEDADQRDLDGVGGADHVWHLSVSGASLLGSPTTNTQVPDGSSGTTSTTAGTGATQLGGAWGGLTITNNSSHDVLLTSVPVSCVYNNGKYDSNPSAINGIVLRSASNSDPSDTNPVSVTAPVRQRNYGNLDDPNAAGNRVVDHMDSLYSEEVRAFLTNYADWLLPGNAEVPTYGAAINALQLGDARGQLPACDQTANSILVGMEDTVTHAHRETLFILHEGRDAGCPDASWINSNNACIVTSDTLGAGVGGLGYDPSNLNAGPDNHTLLLVDQPYASGTTNATAPAVAPDGSCQTWNWETCVFKPGVSDDVRMMDVLWPGTHDSGTDMLSGDAPYRDVPPGAGITKETNCSAPPITTDALGADGIQRWAVTQRMTPRQQLENGIRYLDIRAGWDAGFGTQVPPIQHAAQWAVVHSSFSPSNLLQTLRSISDWAGSHPNEVATVQLGVCDTYSSDGKTAYYPDLPTLETLLEATLCKSAFPNDGTNFRDRTISQVRASKKNLIVVLPSGPSWSSNFLSTCAPYVNKSQDFLIGFQPYDFPTGPIQLGNSDICADRGNAAAINATIAPLIENTGDPGLKYFVNNYKTSSSGAAMGIAGLHYELPSDKAKLLAFYLSIEGGQCPQALIDFGRGLLPGYGVSPTRGDMISQLQCGSIIAVDDFGQTTANDDPLGPLPNYVGQIIGINSWSRSLRTCPTAPDEVILHFSVSIPPNGSVSVQPTRGLFDPQYRRAAAEAANGLGATLSPDNRTITIKNGSGKTIKGIVSAGLAFPTVLDRVDLTMTQQSSGASAGVSAGNGAIVSLNGRGTINVPNALPGPPAYNGPVAYTVAPNGVTGYTPTGPNNVLAQASGAALSTTPQCAASSDGGSALYVCSGNSIAQYDRLGASLVLNPPNVPLQGQASRIAVGKGGNVYVLMQDQTTIQLLRANPTGAMSPGPVITAGEGTGAMAVTPDGRHLYATQSLPGTISEYTIGSDGSLQSIRNVTLPKSFAPSSLTITPDGKTAYVLDTTHGQVLTGTIAADGTLEPKAGAPLTNVGANAGPALVAPDGSALWVLNGNAISVFTIGVAGTLTPVATSSVPSAAGGPISMTTSPDKQTLYVLGQQGTLQAFSIGNGGALQPGHANGVTSGSNVVIVTGPTG